MSPLPERATPAWNRIKSIEILLEEAYGGEGPKLLQKLGWRELTLMGIGVIIGAGIFVITGTAAAQFAGPAIVVSFALAAATCAIAGLCYAEFASLLPISGSAYTYAYATLGEVVAWIIGWNLVAEYVFAASYVAVGWSGYAGGLFNSIGLALPVSLSLAPLGLVNGHLAATGSIFNLPATLIALFMTAIAYRGIGISAVVSIVIVLIKLGVLFLFVIGGLAYANPDLWSPFIPPNHGEFGHYGWSGILRGAAVVFVAYLGFDALSTTAQEIKNPRRDMPIGILASLAACALVYGSVSLALTGLAHYQSLNVPNPLSVALRAAGGGLDWLIPLVDFAATIGLAAVVLVILVAQPRIFLAMGRDRLIPSFFARIHPRFHTPSNGTVVTGTAVAILGGLFPVDFLAQLVSLGTLTVFIVVCAGIVVLRRTRPDLPRSFRVPWSPYLPILGAVACAYLLVGLPPSSWRFYFVWFLIGASIYAFYGRRAAARRGISAS